MSSEEFFSRLKPEVDKRRGAIEAENNRFEANRAFVESQISELLPIAQEYERGCHDNGLSAEVEHGSQTLEFRLKQMDGGIRSLLVAPNDETGKLEFANYYPSRAGSSGSVGRSADQYDQGNWDPAIYHAELQKMIATFVQTSKAHGGL
ncbi:hypothetical protein [Qipengyuania sp. NPDC077563]|uniref:hypothetical protein n=1 Tax=Qipengyuania sp. NPDC077563 TaxID=3364497 RepID=UPI00384F8CFE